MASLLRSLLHTWRSRPALRVGLQASVSLGLLALLIALAIRWDVMACARLLEPQAFLLAAVLQLGSFALNSCRWRLLLAHVGIRERVSRLFGIYLIGQFFSLFLPTSTGGDAVRVYQVSRRHGHLGMTLLATLQERMLGLGAALLIGLAATLYYLPLLPPSLRIWAVAGQLLGVLGISLLLVPATAVRLVVYCRRISAVNRLEKALLRHPLAERGSRLAGKIGQLPQLSATELAAVLGLACAGVLLGISCYVAIGSSLQIDVGLSAFCLVVPLVWVVRMMPVSLNGVGIGEGAFVCLLGLFDVPTDKALTLTLAIFALQSLLALCGGGLALMQILSGTWMKAQPMDQSTEPDAPARDGPAANPGLPSLARRAHIPSAFHLENHRWASSRLSFEDVPVALLAGGLATRLRPITTTIPKALVEVAGRPFIEHQILLLRANGIRKIVMCIGHLGEQIRDCLGDGRAFGMEIQYSFDGPVLKGTGGAIRQALPLLGDTFWIMYGDSYMDIDYRAVFADFASRDALGLMTVLRNENQWDKSNVVFQAGQLVCYDKKRQSAEMTHIDYGIALLRREAIERISPDHSFDLADLYSQLVAEGRMVGHEVGQRFYEIGSPRGLEETRAYLTRRAA